MQVMLAETQGLRWDDVRLFLAVHRERGLAGAARRLGVDGSTTSRRLAAFEAALGVRLFDRTAGGLLPTEAAERILPAAEETEAGFFRFAASVQGLEQRVEGVVRLASLRLQRAKQGLETAHLVQDRTDD